MKLLLITILYPAYKNQSKIEETYSVHYFAREWAKSNDVKVIKLFPVYPKWCVVFRKAKRQLQIDDNYNSDYTIDNVEIKRVTIRKLPKIDFLRKDICATIDRILRGIPDNTAPDIIICDILNPSIYIGKEIARKFNSKLIASLHNSDIVYTRIGKNYKKYSKVDPFVDKIIFRSSAIKDKFMELYQGNKSETDFATVPFGVEKKDIIKLERLERKANQVPREILVACRLTRQKNVDIVIKAFSEICSQGNYTLRIIGDGPERGYLADLTRSLGCKDNVYFEGKMEREEVLKYMEAADVFAMVSSSETFGLVYVEAMAKGCLTIGSKGEGIDGIINHRVNGFLCEPNVEEVKRAFEEVFKLDKAERAKILFNARSTVKKLSLENLARVFLEEIQ